MYRLNMYTSHHHHYNNNSNTISRTLYYDYEITMITITAYEPDYYLNGNGMTIRLKVCM